MLGMLYSYWGNFTGILGWNIVPNAYIYVNLWQLIFAVPYLFYGSILLVFCFTRYFFVYIGSKSINSRNYGEFIIFFMLLIEISYRVGFYYLLNYSLMPLNPIHIYPDFIIILQNVFNLFVLIRFALFGKSELLPVVPSEQVATRREIPTTPRTQPIRTESPRTIPTTPARPVTRPTTPPRPRIEPQRPTPRPTTPPRSRNQPQRPTPRPTTPPPSTHKPKSGIKIDQYQPKAGRLSEEDFKCIFCFNLPKLPEDANRGIILCPTCRHPAHADEFRDWLKNSTLCSRCDAEIPARYQRNPNVISTKIYLKVFRMSMKKIKRR